MNITFHQLKALKAVHEMGSITKAAQSLFMTQPALSNLLKKLEDRVDGALFFKGGKRLLMTNKGLLLLDFYEKIEGAYQELMGQLQAEEHGITGTLKLGCVTTAKYLIPVLLHDFKKSYPRIRVDIEILNKKALIDKLHDRSVDCAILSHPPHTFEVTKKRLVKDKLVVIGSFEDFCEEKTYTLDQLHELPWLIRELGSGTRMSMLACFETNDFYPKETTQVNDTESIKQLVIAGFGISMLPESSIKSELKTNSIKIIDVKELSFEHNWYLVALPKHPNRKLIDNFEQTALKLQLI